MDYKPGNENSLKLFEGFSKFGVIADETQFIS